MDNILPTRRITASYNPKTKITSVFIQSLTPDSRPDQSLLDLILKTSSIVHPLMPFVMALLDLAEGSLNDCARQSNEIVQIERETGHHPYESRPSSTRDGIDLVSRNFTGLLFRLNACSSAMRAMETDSEGQMEQMASMLGILGKEQKEPLIRDLDPGILKGLAIHLEYSIQIQKARIRKLRYLQASAQTQLAVVSVL